LFVSAGVAIADFKGQGGRTVYTSGSSQRTTGSSERLICRTRPVLGSRIARQRVCRTAADWRLYETDLEQSRRDINDRGMRGCSQYQDECF
jgi:hypothetical protein